MFALSIKTKLVLFSAFAIAGMVWVGWTEYSGQEQQSVALHDMSIKMTALSNHLEADKMHDALRGDVLRALYAGTTADQSSEAEILADFQDHAATFKAKVDASYELDLPTEIKQALETLGPVLAQYLADAEELIALSFSDIEQASSQAEAFNTSFKNLAGDMQNLSGLIASNSETATNVASATAADSIETIKLITEATIVITIIAMLLVLRSILAPIRHLRTAISRLRNNADDDSRIHGFTGEFAQIQEEFNALLDTIETRQQQEQDEARSAYRLQEALKAATTCIMLTNSQQQLIYLNDAANNMIRQAETNIRKNVPQFSADNIVGSPLSVLIPDQKLAREIRESRSSRNDELTVGSKTYLITSTPVYDHNHELIGMVSEWHDLSEQREAERQIQNVLGEAIDGRLNARLDTSHFKGFMHTLASNMNSMMDAITNPLNIAAEQIKQIAKGNIPEPTNVQFKGAFNDICSNLNTCCTVLRAMINDTTTLVDAASKGKLDVRANENNHWGDYRSIVEGMNRTLDAVAAPVTEVKEVITGFSTGDLTRRMQGKYDGDFAVLGAAVNTSINNLADLVSQINHSASNINHAAGEISNGNQDLSSRTQEQASTLEETRASLQNLTQTTEENTASAKKANNLAQSAQEKAERGGRTVQDAVVAMEAINKASKQIADIVTVIDGITFQTNLLALNASVEAARAGEQGKGFAVVASEVRNLAQRSAQAAAEIKQLINDTVSKMDHGSELVNASGLTLQEIVAAVTEVGSLISEISASSENQMRDFTGVTGSIYALDDVTQQNAALVEEAAAASESMAEQAHSLQNLMEFFTTNDKPPMSVRSKPVVTPIRKSPVATRATPVRNAPVRTAPARPAPSQPAPLRSTKPTPRRPALKVVKNTDSNTSAGESWSEF